MATKSTKEVTKTKTTKKEYSVKAKTVSLKATSRLALKVQDNYYTIQAEEERSLPESARAVDLSKEWESIFASINEIVDKQAEEILSM